VSFTAPSSAQTITGYTAACGSSSNTVDGSATSVTVSDLDNGTSYSCTLFASDHIGNGFITPWSGTPGPVTP
jgi:hypothetical protein